MSRLPHAPIAQAPEAARVLFDQVTKAVGKVPNAYATIGMHSPAALGILLTGDAAIDRGTLSKKDVEAVRLAISTDNGCDYCVAGHSYIGKLVGLTPQAMQSLRAGDMTGEKQRDALVRFARHIHRSSGTVEASAVQAVLDAGYSPTQVIESLLVISMITFTNLVNRVNDTEVDFPVPA